MPRFGPYSRRCDRDPSEIGKVAASGILWGRARSNIYAGLIPAVKAWDEALDPNHVGFEFYTDVEPDPWSAPGEKEWSEGRPGVLTLERNELVAIPVVMTKRRDPETE